MSKPLFVLFASIVFFSGCYTLKQGIAQGKLLWKRESLEKVLAENQEPEHRMKKLRLIPEIIAYAENDLGLKVGKSYKTYVSLETDTLTWIVQAAEKNQLKIKTWWFPLVGDQPYLGFFDKQDALIEKDTLLAEGFDTKVSPVHAFSLLGYIPDPVYSSMLDNYSTVDLIETLIHESVHQTLYLPNFSQFNESLADYFAKITTIEFLKKKGMHFADDYQQSYQKELKVQRKFKAFLQTTKEELTTFYQTEEMKELFRNKIREFLKLREEKFDALAEKYKSFMSGDEIGTSYEYAFRKGKINNAVILSYSLYEAVVDPFDKVFERVERNPKKFISSLSLCLEDKKINNEANLWKMVEECYPKF